MNQYEQPLMELIRFDMKNIICESPGATNQGGGDGTVVEPGEGGW